MDSEGTFKNTERKGKSHGKSGTNKGTLPSRKAQDLESTFKEPRLKTKTKNHISILGGKRHEHDNRYA
ncbi:MAG: hypothetical protein J6O61_01570 [Butyrivibrio sp.]|nr:hypothetical protein [Butyrivibrio sp.]